MLRYAVTPHDALANKSQTYVCNGILMFQPRSADDNHGLSSTFDDHAAECNADSHLWDVVAVCSYHVAKFWHLRIFYQFIIFFDGKLF